MRPGVESTQPLVLVVDDEVSNRKLMELLLGTSGCRVALASDGAQALALAEQEAPDLILLDIMMPGMDGFEVARRLKEQASTQSIPLVMVSALEDRESRLKALDCGAEEFLSKPLDKAEVLVRVRNLLRLKGCQDLLADRARQLEGLVAERTRDLREAYRDTIFTMVRAAEFKDEETGNHVRRISHFCKDMAAQLGLDATFQDNLFHASPMHDIGKIGIPDAILLKPGPLTPAEFSAMKSHAALGASILCRGISDYLKMGTEIAHCHHERWDGSGYPRGLKGEAIPLSARMMNLADQYDALRSKRPYKPAFTHARTLNILLEGDGRTLPQHFDPRIHQAFRSCAPQWEEIYQSLGD